MICYRGSVGDDGSLTRVAAVSISEVRGTMEVGHGHAFSTQA